jgi:hypothetical protein
MMALLSYAYSLWGTGLRADRAACEVDVAYKLITAMEVPEPSTLAEFRRRREAALAEAFVEVLALCAEAGLVSVGVVAIDGTDSEKGWLTDGRPAPKLPNRASSRTQTAPPSRSEPCCWLAASGVLPSLRSATINARSLKPAARSSTT